MRTHLISIGIGLNGQESHTYAVPVSRGKQLDCGSIPRAKEFLQCFQEYGQWWRIIRVRVLCQMQFVKRP